jgi:hypothetical protein
VFGVRDEEEDAVADLLVGEVNATLEAIHKCALATATGVDLGLEHDLRTGELGH